MLNHFSFTAKHFVKKNHNIFVNRMFFLINDNLMTKKGATTTATP
jgi:hypothetical protein